MIILFVITFGVGIIMLFTGFLRSAAVHSGALDRFDGTKTMQRVRKIRLRRHWIFTLILFAIAIYAALHL